MAKPKSGYFYVYRSIWDEDWPHIWRWWWIDMIHMAKWKDTKTLKRGQLAESLRQLAKRWHVAPSTVARFLRELESKGAISRNTHATPTQHPASVITIINYEAYQNGPKRRRTGTQQ